MDIDEFLDMEAGDEKSRISEEIDIGSSEDLQVEDNGSSNEFKKNVDNSDVVNLNESPEDKKEKVEVPKSNSFKDQFIFSVNEVKKSITSNNLINSMTNLKKLVMLANEIPPEKTDVRHKADTVIVGLNDSILQKAMELRTIFNQHADVINKLMVKVKTEIKNKNIKKIVQLYQQIMSLYRTLSNNFPEEKLAINDKILKLQAVMNDLKLRQTDSKFTSQKNVIEDSLKELDVLVSAGKSKEAEVKYKETELLFWKLPEDHYEEKLKLHAEILKKKNAMDLSMQITSLQSELQTAKPVPKNVSNKNDVQIKKSKELNSSSVQSTQKSIPSKHKSKIDPPPKPVSTPNPMSGLEMRTVPAKKVSKDIDYVKNFNNKFETKPASAPVAKDLPVQVSKNVVKDKSPDKKINSDSTVEDALRKISVAKAKIEIVEGNYDSARALVKQLDLKYPGDSEIHELKSQIANEANKPTSFSKPGKIFEQKLSNIENELQQGDVDKALVDTEVAEQSNAYQDVMHEAGVDLGKSAQSIADAIVHKRIKTAHKFLEAGNKEEARKNIERALKINPLNSEAKMLRRRVQ